MKPDWAPLYNNLAAEYQLVGNSEKMIAALKKAVELEPIPQIQVLL